MRVLRFLSERIVSASFLKTIVKLLFPGHLLCGRDNSKFLTAVDLLLHNPSELRSLENILGRKLH